LVAGDPLEQGLPAKNDNSVHLMYRVEPFAGKPRSNGCAPTSPIVENNFDTARNRDIKPLQMVVLSRF
jgi:hypothetical protein